MAADPDRRPVSYRFAGFVLSPRRRTLERDGVVQPLIPRYFDLLVFLVVRRADAVHRRDIFDAVWSDAIVSESALSQAIRTIRRVLGDDSREPRFVQTVSRHGYRFVAADVVEDDEGGPAPVAVTLPTIPAPGTAPEAASDVEALIDRIRIPARTELDAEDQRDAAERLHAIGTARVLERLGARPGATGYARALLRDTRWDTPEAGAVPIASGPDAWASAAHLVRLRLARMAGVAATRWAATAGGAGLAGAAGGAVGGVLLTLAPGSAAPVTVAPVLALIGGVAGALAGAGVGAGLAVGEVVLRSRRTTGLIAGGALGGGAVGLATQWLATWTLAALVGPTRAVVGGGLEGVVIGAAVGAAYALTTSRSPGLAAPRGGARIAVVTAVAVAAGLAGLGLALAGRPLVGGTVHAVAAASAGGQAVLSPLGRLLGEPGFGAVTAALISLGEAATFGAGLAVGLTRRR